MRWHLKPQHHAVFCMAKIYLIRHAESVANAAGIYQGQTHDTNLSPLGQKQAAALARRLATEKIDTVFTSPLKRTVQTASLFPTPYSLTPDLIETNHGAWEGLPKSEIEAKWPDLYRQWFTQPSRVQFPDGEHFSQTATRAKNWFDEIIQKPGTFVAVTHSNVIMSLLANILDLDLDSMWKFAMQPTAVTLIETHSPAKIIYLNDTSHLKGLKSDLSTHAI